MLSTALAAALLCTGAISVSTTPARALAASDDPVLLDVAAGDGARAGADVQLSATTNVGKLSTPQAVGPGRFRLAFTPPRDRHPQVALIRLEVRRAGSREVAWLALPVDGAETLTLESTKPRARVEVTIGDRTFGPVQAGPRGEADVAVVVPPGVATAKVRSVDRLGNEKVKVIDLEPPPFQQVRLAIPEGASASWADPGPLGIEIFTVDESGAPATAPPSVTVDLGTIGQPKPGGAPGAFVAELRAPERLPPGRRATVSASTGPGDEGDTLPVPLRAGPPAKLTLGAEPPTFTAGSGQRISIAARVEDAHGNAAELESAVSFSTDLGALEPRGSSTATLRLPDAFAGREAVEISATAGAAVGRTRLELRAGTAATAATQLPEAMVRVGDPPVEGTLLLRDSFGNPVRGASVGLTCTVGKVEVVREMEHGVHLFRLGASASDSIGTGRLVVRADGGAEIPAGEVVVLPLPVDLGLSVGLRAGVQTNLALLHGGGGLLEVALRPVGRWPAELLLEAGGSALIAVRTSYEPAGPAATISTDLRWATLGFGVRASLPFGVALSAFGALSGGVQHTWASYALDGGGGPTLSWRDAGLGAFGRASVGLSYRGGPGRLVGELQITYAPPPSSTALGGNLGQATALVGYLLELR